jgi:hypothetical protein
VSSNTEKDYVVKKKGIPPLKDGMPERGEIIRKE